MMKKLLLCFTVTAGLVGCSSSGIVDALPDNRPNYKTSRVGNPLEIPPDLTQSSIDDSLQVAELSATSNASLNTYQNERQAGYSSSLANSLKSIQSSGDSHWIEIQAQPDAVFNQAKRFWQDNGLALSRIDANIGIMETDWLEPRTELPTSGLMRIVGSVLSGLKDSGVRDKFRTRIDYDGTKSFVYLTHYSATEEQFDGQGNIIRNNQTKANDPSNNNYAFIASGRNPELEIEMLRRLNLYLHKAGGQVSTAPSTNTVAKPRLSTLVDGTPALVIADNFNRAWQRLGIAIDRAGFDIGTQNRQSGLYDFAKVTERKVGFIIKETERDIINYQIGLSDQGNQQVAVLRRANNQRPTPAEAKALLEQIAQSL